MSRIEATYWVPRIAEHIKNMDALAADLNELSQSTARPEMERWCEDKADEVNKLTCTIERLLQEIQKGTQ